MRYEVLVSRRSEFIVIEASSLRDAVDKVLKENPDVKARSVDSLETDEGADVIAMCEACGTAILTGETYCSDEDGIYLCQECMKGS